MRWINKYIWLLCRYAGERDKFGRIHGRGTVYFPNGRKFVGNFSHGARCGEGELFEREGARILSGTYVHDRLSGHCEISTNEGGAMEYTFARGVASGPVRRFSPTGFLQGRLFKINQNVPVNSSLMVQNFKTLLGSYVILPCPCIPSRNDIPCNSPAHS